MVAGKGIKDIDTVDLCSNSQEPTLNHVGWIKIQVQTKFDILLYLKKIVGG